MKSPFWLSSSLLLFALSLFVVYLASSIGVDCETSLDSVWSASEVTQVLFALEIC